MDHLLPGRISVLIYEVAELEALFGPLERLAIFNQAIFEITEGFCADFLVTVIAGDKAVQIQNWILKRIHQ